MSELTDLFDRGLALPGQDPFVITKPGGKPEIGASGDRLTTIARAIAVSHAKQKMEEEEKQKVLQDQMSTYQTLRDNGYSPAKAHAAVLSGEFPKDLEDAPDTTKRTKATADVAQTEANTAKIKKETELLDDKKNTIESKILNKIANGETLSDGEHKIYEDVIKKKNVGGLAALLGETDTNTPVAPKKEAPAEEAATVSDEGMIKLWDPRGKPVKAPKKNLERLKAKGYKER